MHESFSKIGDWLKGPKKPMPTMPEAMTRSGPRAEAKKIPKTEIGEVVTDQNLLSWYYRKFESIDTQPVATDKFMHKSKNEYNAAWLARELVQNFVDGNDAHPYTLDGVDIASKVIDKETGAVRFTIRGNWKFEDLTGLTTLHSDKKEGNTAGGNGIGLKQAALRFLRDFGVKHFEIQGEHWTVSYRLAKKDQINQQLQEQGYGEKLRHDWLLADINSSRNEGQCVYIIDTNNQEVIKALKELPNLGVSQENAFLRKPDFKNAKGALKWLPIKDGDDKAQGRLFINGQVMNFKEKGKRSDDYWKGPELLTIQLNNVDYKINIDRPPVDNSDFGQYIDGFIQSMSEAEAIEQLKKSEYIWNSVTDIGWGSGRQGCFVVIEAMVNKLDRYGSKYDKNSFAQHFGGKKYLCWDRGVNEHQIKDLEKQGFVICPSYFEKIGMPKASSKLDSIEVASNEKPMFSQYRMEQIAEEYGLPVAYEKIKVANPEEFLRLVKGRLSANTLKIEAREDRPNTFRLYADIALPKELLFHQLPNPKTEDQKFLYNLRSIVFAGLENRIFEKIFASSGEYITTFNTDYDSVTAENNLVARNVKCSSDQGVFVEFELPQELADKFQAGLIGEALKKGTVPAEMRTQEGDRKEQQPGQEPGLKEETTAPGADFGRILGAKQPAEPSEIGKKLQAVPVEQPKPPAMAEKEQRVIVKNMQLSPVEQGNLDELEKKMPEIVEAVATLESIAPAKKSEKAEVQNKYLQWRNSKDFYGQAAQDANYLTGRHLLEIAAENNRADIAIAMSDRIKSETENKMARLNATLKELANRYAPPEDQVDDFEIVLSPTKEQLAKIGILRAYAHATTGVSLPNDVFFYEGTGSKGVNIGQKAIGLHQSLSGADFKEALGTFTHEIAHNAAMDHGVKFMHTMEALFSNMNETLVQISAKLLNKEELSENELTILELRKKWDREESE